MEQVVNQFGVDAFRISSVLKSTDLIDHICLLWQTEDQIQMDLSSLLQWWRALG